MAGEAKTESFILGTATIMLGPQADLANLGVAHSIGLVKNCKIMTKAGYVDLTQGVRQTLVATVQNSDEVTIEAESFEFTAANMNYALGLDGSTITPVTLSAAVKTAIAAPTPPALTAATVVLETGQGVQLVAGDSALFSLGAEDQVFLRKVTNVATDTLTLSSGFPVAVPLASKVTKANIVAIGSRANQIYLACKIVGIMADGTPVVIEIPKVRVTSGLSVMFGTDKFEGQPVTMKVFDLLAADPLYTEFQTIGPQGKPAKARLATVK